MVVSCWRGRISRRELHEHLDAIAGLPLRTDGACELLEVVRLALLHRVTVYDAAYLELALRREGVLATLDRVSPPSRRRDPDNPAGGGLIRDAEVLLA